MGVMPRLCAQNPGWVVLILVGLAALLFLPPLLQFGLVNYDDHDYLRDNPMLQPFSTETLRWLALNPYQSNWNPLSWWSHALDLQLFGQHWGAHHAISVLMHLANGGLVFWVGRLLLRSAGTEARGADWASVVACALFLFHPVQVEAISWLAERKTLLFAFFYLLAVGAWLTSFGSTAKQRWGYLLAWLAGGLAMAAKPMAVSLPVVLLLLELSPLRSVRPPLLPLALRLAPLVLMAGATVLIGLWSNAQAGTLVTLPLWERLLAAPFGVALGLWHLLLPLQLGPYYPFAGIDPLPVAGLLGSLLLLLLAIAFGVWRWQRSPWILIGLAIYLAMLLPVMVPMAGNPVLTADRYLYLPLLVPGLGVGLWLTRFMYAHRFYRRVGLLGSGLVLLLLGHTSWLQMGFWQDSEQLWTRVLATGHDQDPVPWLGRGFARLDQQYWQGAQQDCQQADSLRRDAQSQQCLGEAWSGLGELDKGAEALRNWWSMAADPQALNELGLLYLEQGQANQAQRWFQRYVQHVPGSFIGPYNLAAALAAQGQLQRGCQLLQRALQLGFGDLDYLQRDPQLQPLLQAGCRVR